MNSWANLQERLAPYLERARVYALPILGGFFLLVFGSIGWLYYQEQSIQSDLQEQVRVLDQLLNLPATGESTEELEARINAAKAGIPTDILPDRDVFWRIRDLAAEAGVKVQSQKSGGNRSTTVGKITYAVHPFTLAVQGNYLDILDFIGVLEGTIDSDLEVQDFFSTLVVRKAQITASGDSATVNIDYEVLALRGSSG